MKRSEYEAHVADTPDPVLNPRGFTLTAQPPADRNDATPSAVYEADPGEFQRQLPRLASRYGDLSAVSCIDLFVRWDPATQHLTTELEGFDLAELARMADQPWAPTQGTLRDQLVTLATTLSRVLTRLSAAPGLE